jgi:spore maturation protein CgeB
MYVRYRPDASDIREQVTRLLQDPEQVAERAARAAAHCREHHTHERRWAQLLETMAIEGGPAEASHPG